MWLAAGCAGAMFWFVAWTDLRRHRAGLPLRGWLPVRVRVGRWFTYVWLLMGAILIPVALFAGVVEMARG